MKSTPTSWPSSAASRKASPDSKQRLVSRNGDLWFFLTNEERDVAREIGHVEVSANEKWLLSELIYDDILGGQTKVRHKRHQGRLRIQPPARRRPVEKRQPSAQP
jgi:hypothetical protein